MAVTPINLARISFNQRMYNLQEAIRRNETDTYQVQNSLTTGLRFQQPSEDPLRAASAASFDRRLERLDQVSTNLRNVNGVLTEVESAAQEGSDVLQEAHTLVINATGDTATPDERQSLSTVVDSLLDQLVSVSNRRYLNTYLFSGHQDAAPFDLSHGGVYYTGDADRREAIVEDDLTTDTYTVPGMEFFSAVSSGVQGAVDLDPALTRETRISTLGGVSGRGVQLGQIAITVGKTQVNIDLSGAATVGDVIDRLNAELPKGMSAEMGLRGITLNLGDEAILTDLGGGRAVADLGLASRLGPDLNPRLTTLTPISALRGGDGLDLSTNGFVIRNGELSATIDLSNAETVEDVLNAINQANVGAWASISEDGKSIQVVNRVSGTDLQIGEDGGQTATLLGIRSMHAGTTLASMNDGAGVQTAEGDDFRITVANGSTIDVDVDGATTLAGLLARLNAAGRGQIVARLAERGNGLEITDLTVGGGALSIQPLNNSPALEGLGLDVVANGNVLSGRDVNSLRADSPFTALIELRDGLLRDDRGAIQAAGQRLERVMENMQRVQGQIASQAKTMAQRSERVETETTATRVLQSDVRDVDFTDATIRFQQLQTALHANLMTASKVMNLSLLDFLPQT